MTWGEEALSDNGDVDATKEERKGRFKTLDKAVVALILGHREDRKADGVGVFEERLCRGSERGVEETGRTG